MKKMLSRFLAKTFTLTLIFALLLSGCSNSLFMPIIEDLEEYNNPDTPALPTGVTLVAEGLYYESDTGKFYTNGEDLSITLTAASAEPNWQKYKIWEGSALYDEPDTDADISLDPDLKANLSYSLTDTGEGTHRVNVKLMNDRGEESDTATLTLVLDKTPPVFNLALTDSSESVIDTSTSQTSVQLSYRNLDEDNLYEMRTWRNDSSAGSYVAYANNTTGTIESDGESYYYSAQLKDKAGNESSVVDSQTLYFNITNPEVSFLIDSVSTAATSTQDAVLDIYTTILFSPSGFSQPIYIAIWDDSETEPLNSGYTKSPYLGSHYTHTLPSENGDYTISVRIREGDENFSGTKTNQIRFDNTAPVISSFTINGSTTPDATNEGDLSLAVNVSDNLAVTSEMVVKLWEGLESDEPADSSYVALSSLEQPTLSADGNYTYWVRVKDDTGNESDAASCTVKYDSTAPEITQFLSSEGSLTQDNRITLQTEASSDATEIKIWQGSAEPDDSYYAAWSFEDISFDLPETEAIYSVHARVRDDAGNESEMATISVTYDQTSPTLSFTINGGDPETNTASVSLTLTTQADVTGIKVWESSEPSSYTAYTYGTAHPYTLSSPVNGSATTIHVKVQDGAKNDSNEATGSIIYDNTVGTPVLTIDQGSVTANGLINLTLSADSDVSEMKIWDDSDSEPGTYSVFASATTFTLSDTMDGKSYTLNLKVRDDAGNEASTQASILFDSQSPDVTFTINGGTHASANPNVDLAISASTPSGSVDDMRVWLSTESEPDNWDLSFATSYSLPDLTTEGTYQVFVRVRNTAGTVSDAASAEVIYDTAAPVVSSGTMSVSGHTSAFWTNSSAVTIFFSGITDMIGSATTVPYQMKIWSGSTETGSWDSYSASTSRSLSSGDGTYNLHARFRDEAGNESGIIDAPTIYLDTVSPTVDLSANAASPTNTSDITFSFNGYDLNDIQYQFWVDSATPAAYADYVSTLDYTFATEGQHTFHLRVKDLAGNVTSDSLTLTYDITPPSLSLSLLSSSVTNDRNVNLSLTSASAVKMALWHDTKPDLADFVTFTSEATYQLPAVDGSYTIYASVVDSAGNEISTPASRSVTLDTTAPGFTNFTVNGSASPADTKNGTLALALTADGTASEMKIWTGSEPSDSYFESFASTDTLVLPSDGDYTVSARVRDSVGNKSGVLSCNITYDSTAPWASFAIAQGSATNSRTINLTITPSDLSDTYKMAIWHGVYTGGPSSESGYVTYSSTATYTLPTTNGEYDVFVRLIDVLGNATTLAYVESNKETTYYDSVAPVINSFTVGGSDPTSSSLADLTYSLTETGSGAQVSFSNSGVTGEWSPWETADGTHENWNITGSTYGGTTASGVKTVYMRVRDLAGNGSDGSITRTDSVTYDKTGPSLNTFTINDDSGAYLSGYSSSRSIAMTLAATDSPATMVFWDNTISEASGTSSAYSTSASYTLPNSSGNYTVFCRLYDSLGNGSNTLSATVTLDISSPTLNNFTINGSTAPDDTNDPVLDIEIDGSDNIGIGGMKIWVGSSSDEPGSYSAYDAESTFTLSSDNIYTVWIKLCDNAGNESLSMSHLITLDTVSPELYFVKVADTYNGSTTTVTTDGIIYISPITDEGSWMKIWYQPSSEAAIEPSDDYISFSSNYLLILPSSGTYKIHCLVKDEAGNIMSTIGSSATITY